MIKETVTDGKFNNPMKAEDMKSCLNQHLDPSWCCCTPEELLRESLKCFNLKMNTPEKGASNSQVPRFIVRSESITLYVSNRQTVCGKKQMLYFFLEYIVTGKIKEETDNYIFTVDHERNVIPCIQAPNREYKMDETPGLNTNAETLLGILSSIRK